LQKATHQKIAGKISEELFLNKHEASLLEIGSITPDSWMNFPHHKDKELDILTHLFTSKELYLNNDDECYHHMGLAFHYIQDRWTLRQRSDSSHIEWERIIETVPFLNDVQFEEFIRKSTMPTKAVEAYLYLLELFHNDSIPSLSSACFKMKEWGARDNEELVQFLSRKSSFKSFRSAQLFP